MSTYVVSSIVPPPTGVASLGLNSHAIAASISIDQQITEGKIISQGGALIWLVQS